MRSAYVLTAACLGLALAAPSWAGATDGQWAQAGPPTGVEPPGSEAPPPPPSQPLPPPGHTIPTPDWPYAHEPGTGESGPASAHASNINESNTVSPIAPHFASPDIGPGAGPEGYLQAALQALEQNRTGEAQQSLEMAETRLLDRSTPVGTGDRPDQNPRVLAVSQALHALARNDIGGAEAAIHEAMRPAAPPPAGFSGVSPYYGRPPSGYTPPAYPQPPSSPSPAPPSGYAPPPSGYPPLSPGYPPPPSGYPPGPAGMPVPQPAYPPR